MFSLIQFKLLVLHWTLSCTLFHFNSHHSFIHSFFAFLLRRRKCCPSTLENTQTNGSIKPLYKDAIGKASVPVGNSLLSKRSNTNSSLCALGARQNLIFWVRRDHHTKNNSDFRHYICLPTKIYLDLILGLSRTNVCQLIELLHSIVESFIRLILFFCVQNQNLSCFENQSMLNVFFFNWNWFTSIIIIAVQCARTISNNDLNHLEPFHYDWPNFEDNIF